MKEKEQELLEDFLTCNTVCGDLGKIELKKSDYSVTEIDELLKQLPGSDYVTKRMLNYIFSNGLTTGQEDQDRNILDPWLYEEKNKEGQTNYEVLRACIGMAAWYGECGLRLYEGNLYYVKKGYYGILTKKDDGIEEVMAYFIRKDGKAVEKDINQNEWSVFSDFLDIETYFSDNGMILLDPSAFINVRNDVSYLHGVSPLKKDQQRLNLLLSVYERLNYDIDYDGPGRSIIRPKEGNIGNNEVSTSEVVNNGVAAQEARNERAKQEVKRVAKQIKSSSSDSVILLSNAFGEKIEHLPRVTKATEFFNWIESDTVIMAQMLGMSPTLLEVGNLHGNVSVEKIIDNAMLNTIIPMRESYAVQFSKMISDRLGVDKIYFNKYDLEQVRDENELRAKVASMIKDLSTANKATPNENTVRLIEEFDEYLRSSIYDDNGNKRSI